MQIDAPSQHVLPRTSVIVTSSDIEVRFTVAMPGKCSNATVCRHSFFGIFSAQGRSIMGPWAAKIVTENVPTIIRNTLFFDKMEDRVLRRHVLSVEDQEFLRFAQCSFVDSSL